MFLDRLSHHCLVAPNKTAIELLDAYSATAQHISYSQLESTVLQTMAMLCSKGVQPGDRVAIQLRKGLPFVYLHLAVMRLGAISLPLNTGYSAHELAYFLQDSGACLLFAEPHMQTAVQSMAAELPDLQERIVVDETPERAFEQLLAPYSPAAASHIALPDNPHATCLMIYTSGTTGRPKGAELTHRNLTANLDSLHEAWGWRSDDVLLHVLPLFHVHGLLVALHGALHAGATTILAPKFDPMQTLELLVRRPCSVFMAVPTIHRRLVDAPHAERYSLRHLRLITSGSDRLPDDLFVQFE
ncbi:MAG: AMP-binding protein, partial [Caldilinea sp.]